VEAEKTTNHARTIMLAGKPTDMNSEWHRTELRWEVEKSRTCRGKRRKERKKEKETNKTNKTNEQMRE